MITGQERMLSDRVRNSRMTVDACLHKLDALNPDAVMNRGYTMIRTPDGKVASSIQEIHPGDQVGLTFRDGSAAAEIKSRRMDA